MNEEQVILTVFTPTFNRRHTLPKVYNSLKKQSCKAFIWLIIDDGSTDGTRDLVEEWKKETPGFEIRYFYKENGGMHTAHNAAYANITTELNTCLDSDDELTEDAVACILAKWQEVKDKGYAGMIALDAEAQSGKVIGNGFPSDLKETTLSGYYDNGGKGDKKLIYRTDIICAYPEYPVFEGEKYFSLSYKYKLIDRDYKLAAMDKVVCLVDYQQDGSTNTMYRQYLANPKGFAHWRIFRMKEDRTLKRRIIDCIHYCSSSQIAGNKGYILNSPYKLLTLLCAPFGRCLTIWLKKQVSS